MTPRALAGDGWLFGLADGERGKTATKSDRWTHWHIAFRLEWLCSSCISPEWVVEMVCQLSQVLWRRMTRVMRRPMIGSASLSPPISRSLAPASGLQQVLEGFEVAPELPLCLAADDRLGEFEEAARFALAPEG
jgi:hypothetical protein